MAGAIVHARLESFCVPTRKKMPLRSKVTCTGNQMLCSSTACHPKDQAESGS